MMTSRFAVPAAAVLATLAAGIAACGAPVPAMSRARPPISATPAPVPAAPTGPPTAMQSWCASNGFNSYMAVSSDVARMHGDGASGNLTAMSVDGSQLATDAVAAGTSAPPLGRKRRDDYVVAMGWLITGGNKVVSGDLRSAATAMREANGYLTGIGALVSADCLG